MNLLKRLYRYLRPYRGWAVIAFGSMVIFASTQATLAALIQPLFDEVLAVTSHANAAKPEGMQSQAISGLLRQDRPEAERGPVIQTYERMQSRWKIWWRANRSEHWRWVLAALLIVFVTRAFTAFFSEYAFQRVRLSPVWYFRNDLYESIIHQSHRFFSERSTGELVSRVVSDADAIQ